MSPDYTSDEMALDVLPRQVTDAFLLSSSLCNTISNFTHKSTSFLDCVIEGMGEMKEQCLLYPQKGTAHRILGGTL